jgi:hypothetical protein
LEARFGAGTNNAYRLDELSDEELDTLLMYVCQTTVDNPASRPHRDAACAPARLFVQ